MTEATCGQGVCSSSVKRGVYFRDAGISLLQRHPEGPASHLRSLLCVLALSLHAIFCVNAHAQADSQGASDPIGNLFKGLGNFLGGIVAPKGVKLSELVESKKYEEAAAYYEAERAYFDAERKAHGDLLKSLADALNAERVPVLRQRSEELRQLSVAFDATHEAWPRVREALSNAERAMTQYDAIALLKDARYRSPEITELSNASARLKGLYEVNVVEALRRFDLLKDRNFFDVYPVVVNANSALSQVFESVLTALANSSAADVAAFRLRYEKALSEPDLMRLGAIYVDRLLAEGSKGAPNFFDRLKAVQQARSSGFKVGPMKDARVVVVQVAPEAIGSDVQLPKIQTEGSQVVKLLKRGDIASDQDAISANYLTLIRALPVDNQRKITEKRQENSKYQTGTQTFPNPAYGAAQAKFIQAQSAHNNQERQNATQPVYGWGAAILRGVASGISAGLVDQARQELANTSPTVSEPIYTDYKFNVTSVEVSRQAGFKVWIVDRKARTVATQEIATTDKKSFQIAYNLNEKDPNFYTYRTTYSDEKAVDDFEKSDISAKFSWLAQQMLSSAPPFVPLSSEEQVIAEASTLPQSTSTFAYAAKAQASVSDDPRLESVVVVRNPKGGAGSGFFISQDTVVTNYHVVEGSQMAEIRDKEGRVVVGRVFKSDIGLDLALLRVQMAGKPVQFGNSTLTAGATVEAIGHPMSLDFTITRGIISAVRKMRNPLVRGSREMLVIQTDAAISPGNSGGPLFLGTQVVGVNSQKLVKTGAEGLGFAIHYAEVIRFIQEP